MMRQKASFSREVRARRHKFNANYVMDVLDYYPKEDSPELDSMPDIVEFELDIEEQKDRETRIRSASTVPPSNGGGGADRPRAPTPASQPGGRGARGAARRPRRHRSSLRARGR